MAKKETAKTHITPNELTASLLSVNSLCAFPGAVSSSRAVMFSGNLSQKLVVSGLESNYIQTGMEREFGKYTFSVKMPADGKILKVIDKYRPTIGQNSITENPQTTVIYEDIHTKEIGMFVLPKFFSFHQYFGFEYISRGENINKIAEGNIIQKDTIFLDSPAIDNFGNYNYGVPMAMCYMTHPSVSEDGIMIRRGALEKFRFKTFETRVVEFGSKKIPLNMYGDENNYKSFPEIGDAIHPDGILMVLRDYDTNLGPVEHSVYDLMEPDYAFDEAIYAAGPGTKIYDLKQKKYKINGKVIDVQIFSDYNTHKHTPPGVVEQMSKYITSTRIYYQTILEQWQRLKRIGGPNINLSKEFHSLIVEALAHTDDGSESKIDKVYRQHPIEDFRLQITIEYEITPSSGFKLTDVFGGEKK